MLSLIDKEKSQLVVIAVIVFSLSVLLHTPFLVPNIYSDIASVWARPEIHRSGLPYVSYQFDYPAVVGWLVYASSRGNYNLYVLAQAVALGFGLVLIVLALNKLGTPYNDILIYVLATPTLLIYGFYNWDLLMTGLAILALATFKMRRSLISPMLLGLSAATKFYSLVFLPVLLTEVKGWRERAIFTGVCFLGWLVPNMYFMMSDWSGWYATWVYYKDWGLEDTWLLLLTPNDHYNLFVKGFGFLILGMVVLHTTFLSKRSLNQKLLMVGLAWLLFSYISTPQMVLFLLPLFALNRVNRLGFYLSEVANALVILTWFAVSDPLAIPSLPQTASLIRQAVWFVLLASLLVSSSKGAWSWWMTPFEGKDRGARKFI